MCFAQGTLLAAAVVKLEEGKIEEAMGLMSVVASLPNRQYQAWAFFFLGLLHQSKGNQRKVEAAARGQVLTGITHAHTRTKTLPVQSFNYQYCLHRSRQHSSRWIFWRAIRLFLRTCSLKHAHTRMVLQAIKLDCRPRMIAT